MKAQVKKIVTSRPFWTGMLAAGSAVTGALGYASLNEAEQERLATVISTMLSLFGN